MEHLQSDERIFFLWQNKHTVVIGKNQCSFDECNLTALEQDGGLLARRLSGGGAVYHDLGNLNFTFLAHKPNYDVKRQTEVIIRALSAFGIEALATGRNDIVVKGNEKAQVEGQAEVQETEAMPAAKCSGNAYYYKNNKCLHHGTLLVHTDFEKMAKYLSVDEKKLQSKGVQSVRSRVTNLSDHCPGLTIADLKKALIDAFQEDCGLASRASAYDVGRLGAEMIQAMDVLRERFLDPLFRYGKQEEKSAFTHEIKERFAWGGVTLRMDIRASGEQKYIQDIRIFSDALEPDFEEIAKSLKNCLLEKEALESRLTGLGMESQMQDLVQLLGHSNLYKKELVYEL